MLENYSSINQGLDVLNASLCPYVCMKMVSKYGDNWWNEVLRTVPTPKDLPASGEYDELVNSLDILDCLHLFTFKWTELFRDELCRDKRNRSCRAWAMELKDSRCVAAHRSIQDIDQHEAERALDTMVHLCQALDEKGAIELRSIYREVRDRANSRPEAQPKSATLGQSPLPKKIQQDYQPGTLEWYLQNAKKGDVAAQCELGRRYATGEGVTEDKKKATEWYRKAAEQGHAKAQFQLAELLYFSGCSSYRGEAVAWYRKAAEQGLPEAQCAAGIFDPANKFKWIEKASEQGYAPASQSLGGIYLQYARLSETSSVSYSNNISEALTWFLKAVEQGDSDSAFFVGECYNMQGDKSEALKWFSKYVELSDSYSTVRVGESFFRQGDKAEALKWYLKSVELGETAAIPAIPMIYEELGNAAEAVKWYLKAAEGGSKTAAERLKKLQADE